MHRFRSSWLALVGGALLIALSVSAAFGADPATTAEPTRGRTIAAFVHELVFGTDDDAPEANEQAQQTEESDSQSVHGGEAGAHGACVSEVARDKDAVGGRNDNHGGAVSEAARETCRTGAEKESTGAEDDEPSAREQRAAERAAAKAEREAARAERKANAESKAGGNGHGRGGSRP